MSGRTISDPPALVPELDVEDLATSLGFYVGLVGFDVALQREEERFAYLVRGDVHLMLEEAAGPGRRLRTAVLEHPYGRGINLQIRVSDVVALSAKLRSAGVSVLVELEQRWYRQGDMERGNQQFVVADPDGYLLRFFGDLGLRQLA